MPVMMSSAAVPSKTFRASRKPFRARAKTVRLPAGITVRLQPGILFVFTPERFSRSPRNPVRLPPESTRGSGRLFVSPQAANTFHLEAGDSHRFACPLPPSFSSAGGAAEMNEIYWQAVCRDIPFLEYATSPPVRQATESLRRLRAPCSAARAWVTATAPVYLNVPRKAYPVRLNHDRRPRYRTPAPGKRFREYLSGMAADADRRATVARMDLGDDTSLYPQ